MQDVVGRIRKVLIERINPALAAAELTSETVLVGQGLALNSIAILELVTGLEEELDLVVADEELSAEVFQTIGTLARFLEEQAA